MCSKNTTAQGSLGKSAAAHVEHRFDNKDVIKKISAFMGQGKPTILMIPRMCHIPERNVSRDL